MISRFLMQKEVNNPTIDGYTVNQQEYIFNWF